MSTPPPDAPPCLFPSGAFVPWRHVVRAGSPEEVLGAIATATGCALRRLDPGERAASPSEEIVEVDRWRVGASGPLDREVRRSAARAAGEALRAWEAARDEVRRANLRAAEYGKDVEALQSLGQALASARNAEELLEAVAGTLHDRIGLDACGLLGGPAGGGSRRWLVFRPGSNESLRGITTNGVASPGEGAGDPDRVSIAAAPSFDPGLPPRIGNVERHAVLVPVPVREADTTVLAVVPTAEPDPRTRRIVDGVAGLLALHLDRMAAAAREDDVRFRAILDGMPQAVWLLDPEVHVLKCNRAAESLASSLPLPPAAPLRALGSFDVVAAVEDVLGGGTAASDSDVRLRGGRIFSVTVTAVRDSADRAVGAVVVADDVTEARRLQSRVAQSERLSSLGRMLSGVAHELNNPLATVIGFAEIARAAPDHPGLDRRLRLIHDEADRCRRIVGNLLRFARRHETERKAVILNELVEATLGLLAYPLRVDGIRAETDLDRSLPAIQADPHGIQQVLVNLITNAHQAIRSTGSPGVVTVRTARKGEDAVVVEVQDDGPGIPEDVRDRIFDPFFTTKPAGEGTGLGLSLVYGTVRSHGGTVEVESAVGRGARFAATLPRGYPGPAVRDAEGGEAAEESLRGVRVLVVDDEPGVSLLLCEALSRKGCRTRAANDAASVLTLLREEAFDVIMCDLHMAGLGAERLHRLLLQTRPELARAFVLTTGDTVSPEPERVAKGIGAIVVHKPFDMAALLRAVGSARRRGGER